jgi:hypothetical protein
MFIPYKCKYNLHVEKIDNCEALAIMDLCKFVRNFVYENQKRNR